MNGYIKVSDAAEKWGIGARRIVVLCNQGRIEGAVKFGNTWAIPEGTEKPKDARIKSGKYIKNNTKLNKKMTKKAQKMSFRAKSETYMQKYVMMKLVMTRESLSKITKNRRTKK